MTARELPPMPVVVSVAATVRGDEPVAVLVMTDVMGETFVVHLRAAQVHDLLVGLTRYARQDYAHRILDR